MILVVSGTMVINVLYLRQCRRRQIFFTCNRRLEIHHGLFETDEFVTLSIKIPWVVYIVFKGDNRFESIIHLPLGVFLRVPYFVKQPVHV